ncbi:winged helix-turn-helix transcriptional regulator [Candidatus Woesearchaeota archaeon]|nr:winged helix-turn-helix transcriptional regulator [Candidatus Woesearchaeota archaeon]
MIKRGKLEIRRDILIIIEKNNNSIKPTPLLRKSNLATARFKEYIGDLIEKDLVKEVVENEDRFFSLTEKGFKFLEKYNTIVKFIDEFGL